MYLLIGDYHATERELDDCESLAGYILNIVQATGYIPVFLGDLYDGHAVIRAEVQKFWHDFFIQFSQKPIVITGNHDISTNVSSHANALLAHSSQVELVLKNDVLVKDGLIFSSYFDDKELFIKTMNQNGLDNKILICHQTFDGAVYENGYPAHDGVQLDAVPQAKILSGHIHTTSTIGKLFYCGAPRWRTTSDASQSERYLYAMDKDLNLIDRYPTSPYVRVIKKIEIRPGSHCPVDLNDKDIYHIDIHGDKEFVKSQEKLFSDRAKIRIFEEKESATSRVSESDPIHVSLNKWIESYQPIALSKEAFLKRVNDDVFFRKLLRHS